MFNTRLICRPGLLDAGLIRLPETIVDRAAALLRDLAADREAGQPCFNVGRNYAIAAVRNALARTAAEKVRETHAPYGI